MTTATNALYVFLTITISGIGGGVGGALLGDGQDRRAGEETNAPIPPRDPFSPPILLRHTILGVLAAYVVPLFLVLAAPGTSEGIMSKLLHPKSDAEPWWTHLFVLIGFCIVAALAAQSFLTSISMRILAYARDVDRKSEETRQEVRKTNEKLKQMQANPDAHTQKLSPSSKAVMEALLDDARTELSTDQVAVAANLQPADLRAALQDLTERSFVDGPDAGSTRNGWSLSELGKAWLRNSREPSDEDKNVLRTLSAAPDRRARPATLAMSLRVQSAEVEAALERLRRLGLVERSQRMPGGWRLRSAGRSLIAD